MAFKKFIKDHMASAYMGAVTLFILAGSLTFFRSAQQVEKEARTPTPVNIVTARQQAAQLQSASARASVDKTAGYMTLLVAGLTGMAAAAMFRTERGMRHFNKTVAAHRYSPPLISDQITEMVTTDQQSEPAASNEDLPRLPRITPSWNFKSSGPRATQPRPSAKVINMANAAARRNAKNQPE